MSELLRRIGFWIGKVLIIAFTVVQMPAGLVRLAMLHTLSLTAQLLGYPLVLAVLAFDIWMFIGAVRMREGELKFVQFVGWGLLRSLGSLAIFFALDLPLAQPAIQRYAIGIKEQQTTTSDFIAAEIDREKEHFLIDDQPVWRMLQPDRNRDVFFYRYIASARSYSIRGSFISSAQCAQFNAQRIAYRLDRYEHLAALALRDQALCASIAGDGRQSAQLYERFAELANPTGQVTPQAALYSAGRDGAANALSYLQANLLATFPTYVHALCAHYRYPIAMSATGRTFEEPTWRSMYVPLCQMEQHANVSRRSAPVTE